MAAIVALLSDPSPPLTFYAGISVLSAVGLLVEDSIMRDTNGTAPASGVDIEPDNPHSQLIDVVFRRCKFIDNLGGGASITTGNLERFVDAPVSILFEDCDVSWRDDYPFYLPWYAADGYTVAHGETAGSVTVRGGTIQGSAGAGIQIYGKHLRGPTVTIADVTLINTAKMNNSKLKQYWKCA